MSKGKSKLVSLAKAHWTVTIHKGNLYYWRAQAYNDNIGLMSRQLQSDVYSNEKKAIIQNWKDIAKLNNWTNYTITEASL